MEKQKEVKREREREWVKKMAYYVTRDDEHMVKFCVFLFFCTPV